MHTLSGSNARVALRGKGDAAASPSSYGENSGWLQRSPHPVPVNRKPRMVKGVASKIYGRPDNITIAAAPHLPVDENQIIATHDRCRPSSRSHQCTRTETVREPAAICVTQTRIGALAEISKVFRSFHMRPTSINHTTPTTTTAEAMTNDTQRMALTVPRFGDLWSP